MPQTEIVLFRELDGRVPVLEWLDELPANVRNKCTMYINLLEAKGHELRRPQCDYLGDDIYELRPSFAGRQFRILYFFYGNEAVALTHGIKKEKAVPPAEIERAVARRDRYLQRPDRYGLRMPKE
jgi:phage-related protein